jgi:hypothetical protein
LLLWEISSGRPPFEGVPHYNIVLKVKKGGREEPIPDTPADYVKLYTGKYEKCY